MIYLHKDAENFCMQINISALLSNHVVTFHHVFKLTNKNPFKDIDIVDFCWKLSYRYFYEKENEIFNRKLVEEIQKFYKEIEKRCFIAEVSNKILLEDLFILYATAIDIIETRLLKKDKCIDCSGFFSKCPFKVKNPEELRCIFYKKRK